ncbi:MAG: hypothetical protein RLZ25_901 [Pseudomonadota bacterium]
METYQRFLDQNESWARKQKLNDPTFLARLDHEQTPDVLWIGCSDSRVPAEIIVNAKPGEMFVHRNIANQMATTDFNGLTVLQYAVDVLRVKHIIVCGHYNCGGIIAALKPQTPGLLLVNKWLMGVKDLYSVNQDEIESLPTRRERVARLVELNVIKQVENLAHSSIVQESWQRSQGPSIHGWVYGLRNGRLKELIQMTAGNPVKPVYSHGELDRTLS